MFSPPFYSYLCTASFRGFCLLFEKVLMSQFTIYKASAGSGKTYTLVREYLRLALDVPSSEWKSQFKRILAVTFANKAANEMKERILRNLVSITQSGDQDDMGRDLCEMLDWSPQKLQMAAAEMHSAILHNYSDFAICTIDSFMHRIVRTFAHDLGLPLNFDIMTDDKELLDIATDVLLDMAGQPEEKDLFDMLRDFTFSRMEDAKGFKIEKSIKEQAGLIFKEETPDYLRRLDSFTLPDFMRLHRQFKESMATFRERLFSTARKAVESCERRGLTPDLFRGKSTGVMAYFVKVAGGEIKEPTATVTEIFDGKKTPYGPQCDGSQRDAIEEVFENDLKDAFGEINLLLKNEYPLYKTRQKLLSHLFPMALLNRMNDIVREQAHSQDVIHISEFNKQIYEVVREEPVPFVYERMGNRYKHYLIDEFQDTSRMQFQNLLPLLENSISEKGSSLVVGDAKQAIYRFRQGDVRQFVELPKVEGSERGARHGALLAAPGVSKVERMDTNYRSMKHIVEFNNDFYRWLVTERLTDCQMLNDIFIGDNPKLPDLRQKYKKEGGYVWLGFWNTDKDTDGNVQLWRHVDEIIRRQVQVCGFRYSDITILARDNGMLSDMADYLSSPEDGRQPVPLVSSESFLVTNSRVVMLLRAMMLYLANGRDNAAAILVLEYMAMLGKLKGDYYKTIIDNRTVPLQQILVGEGYNIDCERLRGLPLYECCETLLRLLDLQSIDVGYSTTFLGVISGYCAHHRDSFNEFLEWFDDQKKNIAASSDIDAVRLSTIHKAKGLESPVIIYAIPVKKSPPNQIWVELDDDVLGLPVCRVDVSDDAELAYHRQVEAERMRKLVDDVDLLYVATTRPKEKLFVLCGEKEKSQAVPYGEWLREYVEKKVGDCPGDWIKTEAPFVHFSIGEDSPCGSSESEAEEVDEWVVNCPQHATLNFPAWEEKLVVAKAEDPGGVVSPDDHRAFGIAVHALLAALSGKETVESQVDAYVRTHALPEQWRERLSTQIDALLEHPQCAGFFDGNYPSYNECDMMFGGKMIRPDKIIFRPDETWVVDFKSGGDADEYRSQVETYKSAVAAMGYPNVKGFLLFTSSAEVVEI